MRQLHTMSRATDPMTSKIAAARMVESGRADSHAKMICDEIRRFPGMTSGELAVACTLDRNAVGRRTTELEREGRIRRGKARKCRIQGTQMMTWWPVIHAVNRSSV